MMEGGVGFKKEGESTEEKVKGDGGSMTQEEELKLG